MTLPTKSIHSTSLLPCVPSRCADATNIPASATFSNSSSNIPISDHLICTTLLCFNMGCIFCTIQIDRYSVSLFQVHGLTGFVEIYYAVCRITHPDELYIYIV